MIFADAVTVTAAEVDALPEIKKLPFAAVVTEALTVAAKNLLRSTLTDVVALTVAVADASLTLAPVRVVSTDVVDAPLIRAEPRGTRLAFAVTVPDGLI